MPTAVAVGTAYLVWRIGWTRDGSASWLFWPLWLAEVTILLELVAMAAQLWTLRCELTTDGGGPDRDEPSVDVVVICRHEPVEVLRAALLACARIRGHHRTIALDTVGRAELAEVTSLAGAEHLVASAPGAVAPEQHLNAVLAQVGSDLIAVLHGDEIPLPHLIEELTGDFADHRTWMVQGARVPFGTPDRGGATSTAARRRGNGSDTFHSVAQQGMNRHGAAIWCGSGAVVRREALERLGGVPTSTETPAFQLSLRASRHGWRSTYHSEPVTLSLAERDTRTRAGDHTRRSAGMLRAMWSSDSPAWARGFGLAQRMAYLTATASTLTPLRRVAVLAVLAGTLLTAQLPLTADPVLLASTWGLWIGLVVLSKRLLTRTEGDELVALRERWMLMGSECRGLLTSVRAARAAIPDHSALHLGHRVSPALRLFGLGAATLTLGLAYQALGLVGGPGPPPLPRAAMGLAALGAICLLAVYVAAAAEYLRGYRGDPQHLPVLATADVGGRRVPLLDLRDSGVVMALPEAPPRGRRYLMKLMLPGLDGSLHPATVAGAVSEVRPNPTAQLGNAVEVGFTHLSETARNRLLECCHVVLPARRAALSAIGSGRRPGPVPETGYLHPGVAGGSMRPALASAFHAATVSVDISGSSAVSNHRTSSISADRGSTRSADAS